MSSKEDMHTNLTVRVTTELYDALKAKGNASKYVRGVLEAALNSVPYKDEDGEYLDRLFPGWRKKVEIAKLEAKLAALKGEDQ